MFQLKVGRADCIRRNKEGYHSKKPRVGFPGGQAFSQPGSPDFPWHDFSGDAATQKGQTHQM